MANLEQLNKTVLGADPNTLDDLEFALSEQEFAASDEAWALRFLPEEMLDLNEEKQEAN